MKGYSFDTSALIEPWTRHYPHDLMPSLWERIDELASGGVVCAQEQVGREIARMDDTLHEWTKGRDHLFRPSSSEVQSALTSIMASHPGLIGMTKNRSGADPWVIALAMCENSTVVTYEQWEEGSKKIKIPSVCKDLGVPCITFVEFMRRANIKLRVE